MLGTGLQDPIFVHVTRVADPRCFNVDPDTVSDPAFFIIADPDPGFDA
jgi:hypothetical protein